MTFDLTSFASLLKTFAKKTLDFGLEDIPNSFLRTFEQICISGSQFNEGVPGIDQIPQFKKYTRVSIKTVPSGLNKN